MKKILLIIAIIVECISCISSEDSINNMKSPVIVIAIAKANIREGSYCVVLKDANGLIYTLQYESLLSIAIGGSKHIGDTIR